MVKQIKEKFTGVFEINGWLCTRDLNNSNKSHYGENIIKLNNKYYRVWNPYRSKLAAIIKSGIKVFPFTHNSHVLYLGAATGTTVSHISDIVTNGTILAVEISPRPFRKLLALCEERSNIIPVMANARRPWEYLPFVKNILCDIVYQDIAQRDQVDIFLRNIEYYLGAKGYGILCLKTQSIDSAKRPKEVFKDVKRRLEAEGLEITVVADISRYQKGHYAIILRKP